MTRQEQLSCLTDRPCAVCKHHSNNGCTQWKCVFEEQQEIEQPCGDTISRQAAIDALDKLCDRCEYSKKQRYVMCGACHLGSAFDVIEELPSVSTEKTGRWEWNQYDYNPNLGNWHCSECRSVVIECVDKNGKGSIPLYKYCPQCGAKMGVEK